MKYTIWVPVKTGPLWYAIDLSVCVGLLAVGLPVSGLNAFWAAAGCSAARMSAKAIETSRMSLVFMVVLLRIGLWDVVRLRECVATKQMASCVWVLKFRPRPCSPQRHALSASAIACPAPRAHDSLQFLSGT